MIKPMKRLLFILLLSLPFASFGQQHVLFRDSTTIDSFRLTMWVRQLIPPSVPKINPFFDSLGSAYLAPNGVWWRHNGITWQPLTTDPDSAIWATNSYVDSGLASISAGAVDTNNYISSIARLNREIDSVSNIIDSNNTIIYGSLSDLYDTKADKDTLNNFVLHDYLDSTLAGYVDTTLLNDSLSVFRGLFVPYTGATTNVNLGSKSLTTNKVLADTLGAKSSMGIHLHGTGGTGIMVGAGGGGTITFDDYPTTVVGDSVLSTNSSGGLLRYDMKGKLANYLLKSDSTTYTSRGRSQKVADSLAAIIATKGSGTVTSIQLVGGTNVTITPTTAITSSGVYTISATGGGSSTLIKANEFNMLYKANGDTTIRGTTKVRVDTTDLRMEFAYDADTTAVTTDPHGGIKMWGSNRMGMGAIRINDTVSIPAALQRAINAQTASLMFPVFPGIAFTNNYLYTGMMSTVGTASYVVAAYNSTIQHFNWNKYLLTTASGSNSNALIRTTGITNSAGIICGNTKFSGGGGRGTFTFSFPAYLATERIMIGYVGAGIAAMSTDPSSMLGSNASLLLVKDAADATLFFMHSNTSGAAPTKVNTGIIPNAEDVYRLTVYIAPNSTYYMQLEVLSKTGTQTVVINPTTAIPPVSSRMVSYQGVNNGLVGGIISYGIIQVMEEIY